jgi:hypothetical protein
MEITKELIILILWSILSLLLIVQYRPICSKLPIKDKIVVGIIFIMGGPILAAASIFEAILDIILPEGWNDDDDFKGY